VDGDDEVISTGEQYCRTAHVYSRKQRYENETPHSNTTATHPCCLQKGYNTKITGSVTFRETGVGAANTAIDLSLQNAVLGGYITHIHDGPPGNYHIIIYDFGRVYPQNSKVDQTLPLALPYDSAINLNGTFVVHDSTESMIVADGGVGRN
jgi:hypothetical protein